MNPNAHTLHRIASPASFKWLESLHPNLSGQPAATSQCFGMTCMYVHWDTVRFYPHDFVLAIPELTQPPVEYFYACTSGGKRWFCFVITQKTAARAAALVFEMSPLILMLSATGLREVPPAIRAGTGKDYPMAPNPEVLCPADGVPIEVQTMLPDLQTSVCIREGVPTLDAWTTQADQNETVNGAGFPGLAVAAGKPADGAPLFFDVISPMFQRMRINGNSNMASALAALGGL